MIAHVSIHVLNYEKSKDFYVKAIAPLGYEVVMDLPQHKVMGMGVKGNPDLWIVERKENLGGEHAAILVGDKSMVDKFYKAALEAGGKDNGAPGIREEYSPDYYAAFIFDLIGSYIRLSKAGANFKAVCPFHNEKTPSFYVSPSREIFHCFGCNAGGDVFRFVSMIEGVEFPEALSILAGRAGVVLKREDPRISGERKRLLSLIDDAAKYFESELAGNGPAKEYLRTRGLKEGTVRSFRLGFVPDGWENLFGHLSQKGYKPEEIAKAGLALQSSNPNSGTKFYDRFRSRIMFPISDSSGRVVGFSGRIFNKETNEGKYINTPNTVLYDKSKILYLWDRAKNEARKENTCIVVEGQMDALMSHQAGITNTVATSGTAFGSAHLSIIKRLASKLLLAFDNDEARRLIM